MQQLPTFRQCCHYNVLSCLQLAVTQTLCSCSEQADTVRAFLAATAQGYQLAATDPEAAAAMLCQAVTEEKLDTELVRESMQMLSQVCLLIIALWHISSRGQHLKQGVWSVSKQREEQGCVHSV